MKWKVIEMSGTSVIKNRLVQYKSFQNFFSFPLVLRILYPLLCFPFKMNHLSVQKKRNIDGILYLVKH